MYVWWSTAKLNWHGQFQNRKKNWNFSFKFTSSPDKLVCNLLCNRANTNYFESSEMTLLGLAQLKNCAKQKWVISDDRTYSVWSAANVPPYSIIWLCCYFHVLARIWKAVIVWYQHNHIDIKSGCIFLRRTIPDAIWLHLKFITYLHIAKKAFLDVAAVEAGTKNANKPLKKFAL